MQAFEDGKTVLCLATRLEEWRKLDSENPLWNWGVSDYKIKSKPKHIWANEYSGYRSIYETKNKAVRGATADAIRTAVHYIEVINDKN